VTMVRTFARHVPAVISWSSRDVGLDDLAPVAVPNSSSAATRLGHRDRAYPPPRLGIAVMGLARIDVMKPYFINPAIAIGLHLTGRPR
jgi:hypothetical protein